MNSTGGPLTESRPNAAVTDKRGIPYCGEKRFPELMKKSRRTLKFARLITPVKLQCNLTMEFEGGPTLLNRALLVRLRPSATFRSPAKGSFVKTRRN